jgi:hypothetical protein
MSLQDYNTELRELNLAMSFAMGVPFIVGEAGVLYLTARLGASSTWESWQVCWAMFPTIVTPVFIALAIGELVDQRIGLKCQCGQSLTFGRHVAYLMREGGKCPRCERVVVEPQP